ncbi:MAG TPA: hypothetical protein VLA91_08915 [Acidimicrobiia bacterium]|nr:hypothetical protein [Acidimicrobiia bacterium]
MNAGLISPVIAEGWQTHGVGSGWWMGGMMIWIVVFWAALILGVVWLVRMGLNRRPRQRQGPGNILDHRFAEGAITFDEYRAQKAASLDGQTDLSDGVPTHPIAGG